MLQNFTLILSASIARCANGFPEIPLRFKGRFLMADKNQLVTVNESPGWDCGLAYRQTTFLGSIV
jgi:hypothetical protein